jgi:leader peptidase (prepilin peptidase) / N-methyltransferase
MASILIFLHFGVSSKTIFIILFTWSLLVLSAIDILHLLLPDVIVLPILWLGLLINAFNIFTDSNAAILGAVIGYLSLLLFAWLFKKIRKIDGLGRGDCKMFAMLGAWLGWQNLPLILGFAAGAGLVFGLFSIVVNKRKINARIPFGPFLAIAGCLVLFMNKL